MSTELTPLQTGNNPEKYGWWNQLPFFQYYLFMTKANEDNINNSFIPSVALLLNNMIGSGILVQAYVFAESGYVVAILAYIILGYFTYVGAIVISHSGYVRDLDDYGDIAREALGPFGDHITNLAIFVTNFSGLLSYIIIIMTLLQSVIETYTNSTPWYTDCGFLAACVTLLFIVPTCLIRKFGYLTVVSYISMLAISSVIMLVLIDGPLQEYKYNDQRLSTAHWKGFLDTIGSVVFAFSYSVGVFHVKPYMADQTLAGFDEVALTTTIIGVSMCFLIGFVGYYSFRGDTESDILLNFGGTLGAVFKLIVIIHLIVYIPGDFVIMRYSLFQLCGSDATQASDSVYYPATLAIIAVSAGLAIIIQEALGTNEAISVILNIAGGLGASLTSFLIPGLIGMLTLQKANPSLYYQSQALLGIGFFIPFLVVASISYSIATYDSTA
jgi:amino acid permease